MALRYSPMAVDDALRSNRDVWDAWTKIHVESPFYDVASFRSGARPIRLADYEREEIGSVEGKTLLHLQCHFGLDTLSWARLGATVAGVDFSQKAIAEARGLAAELGIPATFVASDLYALPDVVDERFDIVYTSRGVLGWLPDIARWAQVGAHFVKPGGFLYITESTRSPRSSRTRVSRRESSAWRIPTGRTPSPSDSTCTAPMPIATLPRTGLSNSDGTTRWVRS
jgi:2-polyprenyl-3-methyl-5-hydroxy-6-metoxy-1,4-benzoquinol methylase